jgi:toxin FitB
MKFLIDTNIVSEIKRPKPNAAVLAWLSATPKTEISLSVITLGEIEQGIARTPVQIKARQLQTWLDDEIKPRFQGRILSIDEEIMSIWARETSRLILQGKTQALFDSLIAATAIRYNLTLVTRNTKDVQVMPVKIFNPWTEES